MPGLLKAGKREETLFIQNNAFSMELTMSTLLLFGLIIYGLFQKGLEANLLFIMAGMWFYFSQIRSLQTIQIMARMEFKFAAQIKLIVVLANFILSVALVYVIGIYALILPLVVSELVAIIYQYFRKGTFGFKFQFNKQEIIRTSKIGIPLIILSFLYKAFESITSKTIVAGFLTEIDLGLFVFALNIVVLGTQFIKDISVVYRPMLWGNADLVQEVKTAFRTVIKVTQVIGLLGGIITGLSQLGFIILVNWFTVNFINSQWAFLVLSLSIIPVGIQAPSEFVLTSGRINKQVHTTIIWSVALVINILLSFLLIHWGYGIVGVSAALVISQVCAAFTMMAFASRFFLHEATFGGMSRMFFRFSLPLIITILITATHWFLMTRLPLPALTCLSLILQVFLWSVYALASFRDQVRSVIRAVIPIRRSDK